MERMREGREFILPLTIRKKRKGPGMRRNAADMIHQIQTMMNPGEDRICQKTMSLGEDGMMMMNRGEDGMMTMNLGEGGRVTMNREDGRKIWSQGEDGRMMRNEREDGRMMRNEGEDSMMTVPDMIT